MDTETAHWASTGIKPNGTIGGPEPVGSGDILPEGAVSKAWTARGPVLLGILTLAVLVGGFGFWALGANLMGAIIVPGAIEVEQNRQAVQHPDGGVVEGILVREGDVVEAGQLLLRLDPEQLKSELTIVEDQLFGLVARRDRFEAERDGIAAIRFDAGLLAATERNPDVAKMLESNRRLFEQRRDTLAASVEQLRKRKAQTVAQLDGLASQRVALEIQATLVAEELQGQRTLQQKGLAQLSRVMSLEREKARLAGALGEIVAARAQAEGQITEIEIEIIRIRAQRREEAITQLSNQEGRELELAERRRALRDRLARLDVRAPIAGAVHALEIHGERSVIQPAQPVLYIVPRNRPLIVAAHLEPIHVDQVHVGQQVMLRFPAFDTRHTPQITGHVISVSPDVLQDDRSGRSYYRVRVEIAKGESDKLPEGAVLIPGMPVEAFLRTSNQSPIRYLLKPLTDYFSRAFRES